MIQLTHDATFSKRDTWFLLGDGRTIRCRITEGSRAEVVCDIRVRFRKANQAAVPMRPMSADLDVWVLESAIVHKDLARMSIQLVAVPPHVAAAFREL